MLGFAVGAMFHVLVEELIPQAQTSENSDLATMGILTGFFVYDDSLCRLGLAE